MPNALTDRASTAANLRTTHRASRFQALSAITEHEPSHPFTRYMLKCKAPDEHCPNVHVLVGDLGLSHAARNKLISHQPSPPKVLRQKLTNTAPRCLSSPTWPAPPSISGAVQPRALRRPWRSGTRKVAVASEAGSTHGGRSWNSKGLNSTCCFATG